MENILIELGRAFALMLVFEGILPFLAPDKWRRLLYSIASTDDRSARITGICTMIIGVFLLYII